MQHPGADAGRIRRGAMKSLGQVAKSWRNALGAFLLLTASLHTTSFRYYLRHSGFPLDCNHHFVGSRRSDGPREAILDRTKSFCQRWSSADAHNRTLQPFDAWFTHHPSWIVTNESDDRFCVEPGDKTDPLLRGMISFYANQFYSPCKKVHMRYMWSSGWGADFANLCGGMIHAVEVGVPFVVEVPDQPWHYTANKNDQSNLTCPAGDTTCYFLPYHSCPSWKELRSADDVEIVEGGAAVVRIHDKLGSEAYFFLTRKQLWLRRAVYDYKQRFRADADVGPHYTDCTVVHVRRSDVVLHHQSSRRYYPVADYVKLIPEDKLNNPNHYIFLLTDDSGAIDEAHEFFPKLNWKYFDRPRHKGSSGGWENQTPSRNPALEVITLLATFDLAQECSAIVNGHSSFAEQLHQHMTLKHNGTIAQYRVEGNMNVKSEENEQSEEKLKEILEHMRNGTALPSHDDDQSQHIDVVNATLIHNFHGEDCFHGDGIIIVNMLGRLANNLFEAAMAKRMATELGCGWLVIYRSAWANAFPTDETDKCFPNVLAENNNRREGSSNRTIAAIQRVMNTTGGYGTLSKGLNDTTNANGTTNFDLATLAQALNYNALEPEKHRGWDDSDNRANNLVSEWVDSLGGRALKVEHAVYDFKEDKVDQLVSKLKDSNSQVQVLNLGAFFIHFDWMRKWMDQIHDWLHIDPSCCTTPAPVKDAIVIHIRDFGPNEKNMNENLQLGVYRDIIQRYSENKPSEHHVLVVCQPKSVASDIVQALVKEFGAVVQTGDGDIDAFCILTRAPGLIIPSTSSSFSQMAALLAERNNKNVQVHYPTHTLHYPKVTLNVSTWKYHLTNSNKTGIAEFDVDHRLKVEQA